MHTPPLSVLASWPAPNYVDPEMRGNGNLIVNLVLFPLAMSFLILRIYTRLRITKSFGLDDVFILIAAVPTAAFFTLALLVDLRYHLFRHTWDITLPELTRQLQLNIAAETIFAFAFTFTKLAILQLVWRILARSNNKYRLIVLAAMTLIFLEGLAFILTVIFQCTPVSAYWTISNDPQNCLSERTNLLVGGTFNTGTDVLVVLLPIFLIWKLHLPTRQQFLVSSLFALGVIVVVAGAFRTATFYHEGTVDDKAWAAYYVWIPSAVELYTGVLCACIPPTQPLFVTLFPKLFSPFYPQPKTSLHSPILTHIHPLQQHPYSQSQSPVFDDEKPHNYSPRRRNSGITVEDEIMISFQSMDNLANRSFLDLETGLAEDSMEVRPTLPMKESFRSGSRSAERQRSIIHVRPGPAKIYKMEARKGLAPRVQYFKAVKLVRIDTNNPRIRMITPDSAWGTSNDTVSFRGSWTSVSSPNSPRRKKNRRGPYQSPNKKRNHVSIDTGNKKVYRKSGVASSGLANSSPMIGVAIDESRIVLTSPTRAVFHLNVPPAPYRIPSPSSGKTLGSGSGYSSKTPRLPAPILQRDFSSEATETLNRSTYSTPLTSPIHPASYRYHSPTSFTPVKALTSPRSMGNLSSPSENQFGALPSPSRSRTMTSTHYTRPLPSPSRSLNAIQPPRNEVIPPLPSPRSSKSLNALSTPRNEVIPPMPRPTHMRFGSGNSVHKFHLPYNSRLDDTSPNHSMVDSLRTSEIPSLSAVQRAAILQVRGSGHGSGSGSGSDGRERESLVLGKIGGYPQPSPGFKNFSNLGSHGRMDSEALSLGSRKELLEKIQKGYA